MEAVEKVKLYREYNVPRNYLLPLYFELATREEMLEREGFCSLDVGTLYLIVRAREMLRAPRSVSSSGTDQTEEERRLDIFATAFELTHQEVQTLRASGEDSLVFVSTFLI